MMKNIEVPGIKQVGEDAGLLEFIVVLVIVVLSIIHVVKIRPNGGDRHHP